MGAWTEVFRESGRQGFFRDFPSGYIGREKVAGAAELVKIVSRALGSGIANNGEDAVVWAYRSDYKDFIRVYVISDYFKGMSEKARLGEIYSILERRGAGSLIRKISLCVAWTKREYDEAGVFFSFDPDRYRGMKSRPKPRRSAKAHTRRQPE